VSAITELGAFVFGYVKAREPMTVSPRELRSAAMAGGLFPRISSFQAEAKAIQRACDCLVADGLIRRRLRPRGYQAVQQVSNVSRETAA
jgi:hypothetical protein